MLHGFLNLSKPRGLTSHDVVARVRRIVGQRRVGHAGTLDPMAEGVLPIALGRATRLVDRVAIGDKTYFARLRLGVTTTTADAEGEVLHSAGVPRLTHAQIEEALDRFRGEITQVPPAYSAVKVAGQRAYALARRGERVELPPRRVQIYGLRLLGWFWPSLVLLVRCSRGTYIRALAQDIGDALGCGAHLTALVRIAVGPFHLSWAVGLGDLEDARAAGSLEARTVAPDVAMLDLPAVIVSQAREADFRHGRTWTTREGPPGTVSGDARAYTAEGRLLGLMHYDSSEGRWQPRLALFD
jgi:tRNA pseudouridine55 synthase